MDKHKPEKEEEGGKDRKTITVMTPDETGETLSPPGREGGRVAELKQRGGEEEGHDGLGEVLRAGASGRGPLGPSTESCPKGTGSQEDF